MDKDAHSSPLLFSIIKKVLASVKGGKERKCIKIGDKEMIRLLSMWEIQEPVHKPLVFVSENGKVTGYNVNIYKNISVC